MSLTSTSPVKEELEASISRLKGLCSQRPLHELGTRAAQQLSVPAPPALGRLRLAAPDDCRPVFQLCTQPMREQFRVHSPEDVLELINHSVCCLSQVDAAGAVVGFLSAREYPLLPAVHPCAWEEYVWNRYRALELRARNTLWLHLLCWSPRHGRELVDAMLRSLFLHDPHLHHIAFLKALATCMHLVPGASRSEASFKVVSAVERGIAGNRLPALVVASRQDVWPRLKVRRALEADNDDILPILEQHSARLRQLYGQYYISELVAATAQGRSHRRVLVAEHNDAAVGVMILNATLNLEALEECYELAAFAGLRRLDRPPQRQRYTLPRAAATSQLDQLEIDEQDSDEELEHQLEEEDNEQQQQWAEGAGGVGAGVELPAESRPHPRPHPHAHGSTKSVVQPLEACLAARSASALQLGGLLDDEEVEYDILNIDLDLLKMLHTQTPPGPPDSRRNSCGTDQSTETVQDILKPRRKKVTTRAPATPPTPPSPPSPAEFELTRYSGAPNAFLLEVYAIHPHYDERSGFDLLEAAFELFPERDYCVMCVPTHNYAFPLLEHFTLVAPHATINKRFINDSLFVAHVNSVRGEVSTRPCEQADLPHIAGLLESAPNRAPLTALIQQSLLRPAHSIHSHLLLAQHQPIGIVIVGPLEHSTCVRNQFQLQPESRRLRSDGVILGGVMSPALDPHARFYLRDVLRWTRYVTLFWLCRPVGAGKGKGKGKGKGGQSGVGGGSAGDMMSLWQWMEPVPPQPRLPNLSRDPRLDALYHIKFPFALWRIERPLTSVPMVYVTTSIVVVGAGTTGLAFIEALLTSHLTFSNVTLISEHGLPTVAEPLEAALVCIPERGRYTHRYLHSAPFAVYVDVVAALVTAIDRQQKRVSLSSGGHVHYDELVLACGLQFQHPDYLRSSLQRAEQLKAGTPCERPLLDDPSFRPERVPPAPRAPPNLFIINCLPQADRALRTLQAMMDARSQQLSASNPIVVYGACVEAYCCVSALLRLGVAPQHIGFVEPPLSASSSGNVFNNDLVDERVQTQLEQLGIPVLRGWRLLQAYTLRRRVASLCLMGRLRCLTVPCFALFYYGHKAIDIHAFKAINECGLVYEGGVVTGPQLRTNDPHIRAGGPCSRYARRLRARRSDHRHYNSQDVGEALATIFLRKLDPFLAQHPDYKDADLPQLPRYRSSVYSRPHPSIPDVRPSRLHLTQPKDTAAWQPVLQLRSGVCVRATLPGPLHYLRVRTPGPQLPVEVLLALPQQGHTLETDCGGNYCRLRLDRLHCVEAVTCLARRPFVARVYAQLYGTHEAYYNKLLLRYRTGRICDLFEYFLQPWMAALHQHSFNEFTTNLNYTHIGAMYEALRSRFVYGTETAEGDGLSFYTDPGKGSNKSNNLMSCAEMDCLEDQDPIQFSSQSMISRLVMRTGTRLDVRSDAKQLSDLECGQNSQPYLQAAAMWRAVDGDSIVNQHLGAHLQRFRVPNPHYAPVLTHTHTQQGEGGGELDDQGKGDGDDGDGKDRKENDGNKEGNNDNNEDDNKDRDKDKNVEKQEENKDTDKDKKENKDNNKGDKKQGEGIDEQKKIGSCQCYDET